MKITKKNAAQFVSELKAFITNEMKGIEGIVNDSFQEFTVNTTVGEMGILLPKQHNHIYTVFCRFSNVDKAKAKFVCNPYSGKYNFHQSGDIKDIISMAINHIEITK